MKMRIFFNTPYIVYSFWEVVRNRVNMNLDNDIPSDPKIFALGDLNGPLNINEPQKKFSIKSKCNH